MITTSRVINPQMLGEHVRDPMIERDPTRSRTENHPSQDVVNNGQTQSSSLYLYPDDYIDISLAGSHYYSLAWRDVDGCKLIRVLLRASSRDHLIFLLILASPQVPNGYGFECLNVGTRPQSSGGSSEESHTLEFTTWHIVPPMTVCTATAIADIDRMPH